jgi:hypothetical protein
MEGIDGRCAMYHDRRVSSVWRVVISLTDADSWQKAQFSHAYMLAIATRGGYTIATWNEDKDGVDATLGSSGIYVDIQLKCTRSPRKGNGCYIHDLDVKTYDKLRKPERSAPGYLAMLIVPENYEDWLTHRADHLLLAGHGYWARIQDLPPVKAITQTAIRLPHAQRLDVSALEGMFRDSLDRLLSGIKKGEAA